MLRHPLVRLAPRRLGPLLVLVLAACAPAITVPSVPAGTPGAVAAGERIFDSGIGTDGAAIPRTGGVGMMTGAGCAACHGAGGRGTTTMMFRAPDITYANLTDPAGMVEVDGGRGPVYTEAEIRRAVVQGIGADGDTLDTTMPRWQLSDADWRDLLAYLKTLR